MTLTLLRNSWRSTACRYIRPHYTLEINLEVRGAPVTLLSCQRSIFYICRELCHLECTYIDPLSCAAIFVPGEWIKDPGERGSKWMIQYTSTANPTCLVSHSDTSRPPLLSDSPRLAGGSRDTQIQVEKDWQHKLRWGCIAKAVKLYSYSRAQCRVIIYTAVQYLTAIYQCLII